ncbi:MAG: hypothetical protein ABEJ05_06170 [Haloglomus sp.]
MPRILDEKETAPEHARRAHLEAEGVDGPPASVIILPADSKRMSKKALVVAALLAVVAIYLVRR